ncbi:MAG: transcriptional regulator [Firmicutes bacterium GWF2_51_9]|nr:winged helix-turn-helix transcriptional regulator [Erysipelotrichaceae bacterium]OGS53810.1 MAG: transcriptional regulator [Firmicutes bacterium GWF2_51_9]OGS57862.1 MAG: transcriptional regulator [Firmicutes bacterium GWE2_51_13]HAM63898.1 transcriptional regulator [Erysipelotrichaceae bacterium]HAO60391.1 transcriptional regulator [Erysipelotrichaceae bacterium]
MEFNEKLYTQKSDLLKVLAHPIRLCIVRGLLDHGSCNVSHMEGCLNVSQSAISQHLAKLKSAGVLSVKRSGNTNYYELVNPEVVRVIVCLFNEEGKEIA